MKNKVTDLQNHMFAALERLNSEEIKPDELKGEIERAKAVAQVGKVVVDSYKTQVLALKELSKAGIIVEKTDIEESVKGLIRPAAEYSNKDHLQLRKAE